MKNNFIKIILILVAILATNILFKLINIQVFNQKLEVKITSKIILSMLTIYLIFKFGFISKLKLTKKSIIYTCISLLLILLSILQMNSNFVELNYSIEFYKHFTFLISCISVGLFEELFFRVFVFSFVLLALKNKKNNLILAILISSLLFGFSHLSNLFNPNYFKISVINQILLAFSLGLLLQSIYLKYNSIWLIATLHCLVNYFGSYKRLLLNHIENTNETYTFSDFITTFITLLTITILIIIPLSYILIRSELKSKANHNKELW